MNILPTKLLIVNVTESTPISFWTDPVAGPWDGYPYQWTLTFDVSAQSHSSADTPTQFYYTGMDIKVGDWICDGVNACRIFEITTPDYSTVVVKIEDYERFNTFNDSFQSGSGGINFGTAFIFDLTTDGVPNLLTLPNGTFPTNTAANLQSRFAGRDPKNNFISVTQTNHGFAVGDFIKLDETNEGRFELVSGSEVNLAIGIVSSINLPGANTFTYTPLGKLIEGVVPDLVGNYGDVFYLDPANPGKVTKTKPLSNAKPIYIRGSTPTQAYLLDITASVETASTGGGDLVFKVTPTNNQTSFTLPIAATSVELMSINGIENTNFTFNPTTKVLTFDPIATGYGVDTTDEVIFIYQS